MLAKSDDIPQDVWDAAKDTLWRLGYAETPEATSGLAGSLPVVANAILAERKRCADVANERALHLAKGAEAMPGDAAFATQMVEALLIEQRITQGWVAKDTMQVEGLHS